MTPEYNVNEVKQQTSSQPFFGSFEPYYDFCTQNFMQVKKYPCAVAIYLGMVSHLLGKIP
jgi:hypothetical protein